MKQHNRYQCRYHSKTDTGFTLIELMMAMALSAMVIVMIATAYWTQTHSSRAEMEKVGLQQNMRSAMFFIQRDLMMAGYDVDIDNTPNPVFLQANVDGNGNPVLSFQYNADTNNDGTVDNNEFRTITYSLFDSAADADAAVDDLQRQPGGQAIAGNIEAMEFVYSLAPAGGGAATTVTNVVAAANLPRIRAVGVTLLARTENAIQAAGSINRTYTGLGGTVWAFNDGVQRQIVSAWILCRNRLRP